MAPVSTEEFLELSEEEQALVEIKLALADSESQEAGFTGRIRDSSQRGNSPRIMRYGRRSSFRNVPQSWPHGQSADGPDIKWNRSLTIDRTRNTVRKYREAKIVH
jgi:hypothetical protein